MRDCRDCLCRTCMKHAAEEREARLRALLDAEKREADALRSERDDRRKSLAQEIRQTLSTRDLHAPKDDRPESDLIGAVGMALDNLRALLDERTALLRDAEVGRQAAWHQATGRYFEDNLSRRIAATLKETT